MTTFAASSTSLRASLLTAARVAGLLCSLIAAPLFAQEESAPEESEEEGGQTAEQFLASLHFGEGNIEIVDGLAKLSLGERYRYLGAEDTERVLVDAWGNPPGGDQVGMILPAAMSPLDEDAWAVVVEYREDGYVSDDESAELDYKDLLAQMQEDARDSNAGRKKAGYPEVELVGWAEPPHYDATSHKLYWAKQLDFEGGSEDSLNYDIRILGRRGVLVLSAVGGISQLDAIKGGMQDVLRVVEFNPGHRYTDFDPTADRVATYGLGALIAGGVAAKAGLFAKLGALLLAFKKVIGVGLLAIGALLSRLFGRRKAEGQG